MVTPSTGQFLRELDKLDIKLWSENGQLRSNAPKGAITPELRSQIGSRKDELIDFLSKASQAYHAASVVIQPTSRTEFDTIPLSFTQESLWLLEQIEAGNTAYNEIGALRLEGNLRIEAFERALAEIVQRHESLRTTFSVTETGQPVQVIHPPTLALPLSDLSHLTTDAQQDEIQALARQAAHTPFDLEQGPLFRCQLIRLQQDTTATVHVLLLAMHHLIGDVWSMGIFFQELSGLYAAFVDNRPSPLPPLPVQYADYAIWQRTQLSGDVMAAHLAYWQQKLANAPALLELPTDRPRPLKQTFRGGHLNFTIDASLTQSLRSLAQQHEATLFMVMLAAFNVLLARYSRQDDILIGAPIANRQQQEIESLIGFFVNTLVYRTQLAGNPSFTELLAQVKETTQDAYDHQNVSFAAVVSAVQPVRDLSYSPLFQVMFAFQNIPTIRNVGIERLQLTDLELAVDIAKYDLSLELYEENQSLSGTFEYNTDLFDETTIARMTSHFTMLLKGIVLHPGHPVHQLPLLTDAEYRQIIHEWNDTTVNFGEPHTVHALFEQQVVRTPDAVAIQCPKSEVSNHSDSTKTQDSLTYAELNARANQLAHHLIELGVQADTLVAVVMERSVEMVVSLLAVLKAGGGYVPIDPTYPAERIRYMLVDSAAPILLTQSHLSVAQLINDNSAEGSTMQLMHVLATDLMMVELVMQSTANPQTQTLPENIAYVIYTSGTTGQPKGVMIEHHSLANFTRAATITYGLTATDRILQFASISFDTAAEEIYPCLCCGGTLVLRSEKMLTSVSTFIQMSQSLRLTVWDLPTAYWNVLTTELAAGSLMLPDSLRLVIIGGERALPETVRHWHEFVENNGTGKPVLINGYGPTEATICTTACVLEAKDTIGSATTPRESQFELLTDSPKTEIPIGRPHANLQVYILDTYNQPVPIGVPGELHIGGLGLARGYLNRPELTAEKFVPCFIRKGDKNVRMYKTGDLVRWLPDGNIAFVGRTDNQVKLRGFRVELGEIENILVQFPEVANAVVLASQDESGGTRLVAYVMLISQRQLNEYVEWQSTVNALQDYLRQMLPKYMMPSKIVLLDQLPLTTSGKIDRNALPDPAIYFQASAHGFVPPQTPTEKTLTALVEEVTGVKQVGINDSLFDLGTHSLHWITIYSRLQEHFQIDFTLSTLLEMPTIAQMAVAIDSNGEEGVGNRAVDLLDEATLDPTITCRKSEYLHEMRAVTETSVLLTGGTGFLGAFLLYELLQQTSDIVHCLVRSRGEDDGKKRLHSNLKQYGLWKDEFADRIIPIPGDLSLPKFGLTPEQFNALADKVDVIYHNGAAVDFIQPYERLKPVNVLGTQEVLRLAALGSSLHVHYISTLSVFDSLEFLDGRRIYEDENLGSGCGLFVGYSQSKWVAEKLVLAGQTRGIPMTIYRPGLISGQSQTGIWNMDDFFCRLLKGCVQLGAWPQLKMNFNLTPVDYVSKAIVALSRQQENRHDIFHLESPYSLQFSQLATWLNKGGYPLREMPVDKWLRELTEAAKYSFENPIVPFMPLFGKQVSETDRRTIWDLFASEQWPTFDHANTDAVLAQTEITCPEVNEARFNVYITYFVKEGFLDDPANYVT